MCHSDTSLPPAAPIRTGDVAACGTLELTAADDNRFRAYRAVPTAPNGRSVAILPDVRGLHPFYEALTRRFAEAGFHAVAIDYYGRTAGIGDRDGEFDAFAHMALLEGAHVDADVDAAMGWLRAERADPIFTVGFCLGGGHSWRQAARACGVAGAVGFYGPPRFFGDTTDRLAAPLLLLLAGADIATPPEEYQALAAGFDAAGKEYEMHVYDGAPHSYFDVAYREWEQVCTDSWHRVLDFTAREAHQRP